MIISKLWRKNRKLEDDLSQSLEGKVQLAKEDKQIREELIKTYQPFIAKVASGVCQRYIDPSMDEFSIALQGFNEAINKFNAEENHYFLSFAKLVIQRRVIDYIRQEQRQTKMVVLEKTFPQEEQQEESYSTQAALRNYHEDQENETRRNEIIEYQERLLEFGITFDDLIKMHPKHMDARENAKEIAKILIESQELAQSFLLKKQIPMKELLSLVSSSRKTIERNRKYIIAIALIYLGDYPSLRSFING